MADDYFFNIKMKNGFVIATLLFCIDSSLAQWVNDGSGNYTFNSTSTTTSAYNYLTIYNAASGVDNLTATISSSNSSTSSGTASYQPSQRIQTGSMFAFKGQGAVQNTAGAPGPNITLNNSASISLNIATPVEYIQAQPGWATTNPTYTSGTNAVINVISNGTSSTVSQYNATTNTPPWPLVPSAYNGANGGAVAVNVGPSGSNSLVLKLTGPANGVIVANSSGLPWQPVAAVISALSTGGTASAIQTDPNEKNQKGIAAGSGGSGGNVNVQTAANTTLQIGQIGAPVTGSVAGISAVSYGSPGAFCCSNNQWNSQTYPYWYQQILNNGPYYGGNYALYNSGSNGNGGDVTVVNNALITAQNNLLPNGQYGSGIIGIIAASVGGSIQINPSNYLTPNLNVTAYGVTTPSGLGGAVNVTNNGDIYLPGASSIGILATSTADAFIGPNTFTISGTSGSAGAVNVNNTGKIVIGNDARDTSTLNNPTLSAGIIAVSSTGWLFKPFNTGSYASMSAGNGGNVQVNNSGSITTYGATSLGIAALSIGNSGLLVNNGNSTSNTYVGSSVTQNGANSSAGSATVLNSGTVTTRGASSVGILAAANGSGGLFNNNIDPTYGTPVVNSTTKIQTAPLTSGVIMGSKENAYTSAGGSVSVTNSGAINTGIIGGGGEASIGIVAQSVGGGGGSYAGTKGLAWVGDAGGAGGNGGAVSVNNSGTITTINDGSFGILAQSIGGGGGNGAGASGLFAAVGGSGGAGGNGGNVTVSNGAPGQSKAPSIVTQGDYSAGIVAQSVGGGGGNGGYGKAYGIFAAVGIGGTGGGGGVGGAINFANYGKIFTYGDQSPAVVLQSIGGGGGIGGAAISFAPGVVFATAVSVGGTGGAGGNGGSIGTITNPTINSGTIFTSGSDAIGVLSQSIGGGGGHGGSTQAKSISLSPDNKKVPAVAFSTSIGGSGGVAGNGGNIYFQNNGDITTLGTNSHGLVLQSIGGGGGNGGDASATAHVLSNPVVSMQVAVSIGGSGSASGNGGTVNLVNTSDSTIGTYGHNASGILAQSIGGGGGSGGVSNDKQPGSPIGQHRVTAGIAVGGSGGSSGSGGSINVSNDGAVRTYGSSSSAIAAQSIGGGGGAAGSAGVHGVAESINANVAVGGNGGNGGNGGSVSVSNTGIISTGALVSYLGDKNIAIGGDSHGIIAQSIAGGGGIGGSADPSANAIKGPHDIIGKSIETINDWLAIKKYFSNDGPAPINYQAYVGVGGKGGVGGVAGVVNVDNSGQIQTIGHRSFGILAQSIGGGGGTGGSVMSRGSAVGSSLAGGLGLSAFTGLTFSATVNVGGSGGTASAGNTVNITQTGGSIITAGYGSHGVVAQSIGGGGGVGSDGSIAANTGFDGAVSKDGAIKGGFTIALGSTASQPAIGSGGTVNYISSSAYSQEKSVTVFPSITTFGDNAVGILAQSIGGGGGIGSGGCTNNGLSLNASPCFTNAATTPGTSAPIKFINGGQAMTFTINPLAGSSTTPSNGGTVNITSYDEINVFGSGSIGIVAQSIGGGGGLILGNSANIASATLPAMGTSVGTGGQVNVTVGHLINLAPTATGSIGVLAQSIGGGGGFLGDPKMDLSNSLRSFSGTNVTSANTTSGGSVSVAVLPGAAIRMYGANQIGIVAQSVGGGGGFASTKDGVVTQNTALTQGSQSGSGGSVQVDVYGSIIDVARRGGTVGVFAQSQGNSTNYSSQNVVVSLFQTTNPDGSTTGGVIKADTGVVISGGSNGNNNVGINMVNVGPSSLIEVPRDHNAIVSTYGTTNVNNYGTIIGGISIGPTSGFNAPGGSVDNYGTVRATGTISAVSFNNIGNLYIGGMRSIGQTDMYGTFRQGNWFGGNGTTYFDFSSTLQKNDFLRIVANSSSAGTMLQGGQFVMNRIDSNKIPVAGQTALLVTAEGGFVSSAGGFNATPITISDTSPIIVWDLIQQGNNLIAQYQGVTSHPKDYRLAINQQNYLDYIVKAYKAADAGVIKIMSILASTSHSGGGGGGGDSSNNKGASGGANGSGSSSYDNGSGSGSASGGSGSSGGANGSIDLRSALNALNGTALTTQSQTIVMTGNAMLGNALGCPTYEKNGVIHGETECAWGKYNGGQLRQATSDTNPGYTVADNTFSLGIQRKVDDDAFVGAAIRFGFTNTSSATFGANANVGDVSIGYKKLIGDYVLGLSGALGVASQRNNRYTTDYYAGQNYNMTSQSNSYYGGLRARNAYQFNLADDIYVKPYLDLDALWIRSPAYQESGSSNGVPLQFGAQNSFNFIASPMVELGARINLASKENAWVRPFISAGAMFITNNTTNLTASIIGANSGTYQISTQAPNAVLSANAGIQFFDDDGIDAKLEYSIQAGQGYLGQSGTVKLNYKF